MAQSHLLHNMVIISEPCFLIEMQIQLHLQYQQRDHTLRYVPRMHSGCCGVSCLLVTVFLFAAAAASGERAGPDLWVQPG